MERYMPWSACRPTDQVFTHEDPDTGKIRHFNASAIERFILSHPGTFREEVLEITDERYGWILKYRGIEEPKVQRLLTSPEHMSKPILGIITDMSATSVDVVTIDGHHRMIALYRLGRRYTVCRLTPPSIWENFLVALPTELSDDLRKDWLGGQDSVYMRKQKGQSL